MGNKTNDDDDGDNITYHKQVDYFDNDDFVSIDASQNVIGRWCILDIQRIYI